MIDYPSSSSLFQTECVENEVLRDGLIDTINMHLNSENRIVVLRGERDIGKTVLMNQFLKQNPHDSISIFIPESYNTSFIEENILKDLYIQANSYLKNLNPQKNYSEKSLNSTLQTIQYNLKKEKTK